MDLQELHRQVRNDTPSGLLLSCLPHVLSSRRFTLAAACLMAAVAYQVQRALSDCLNLSHVQTITEHMLCTEM